MLLATANKSLVELRKVLIDTNKRLDEMKKGIGHGKRKF